MANISNIILGSVFGECQCKRRSLNLCTLDLVVSTHSPVRVLNEKCCRSDDLGSFIVIFVEII